jgi:hypothetical protein
MRTSLMTAITNQITREKLVKSAGGVLYLDARKSTGYGQPINSPLTTPWKDLSGNGNDATPTNMAGTTASGVDTTDPLKPCWVLDGTDDFFSLVNTASLDITSAPLGVFATVKDNASNENGFIFCKALTNETDTQYGLYWSASSYVLASLNGAYKANSAANAVSTNTWYNVGFIWNGATVKVFVNKLQSGTPASFNEPLNSRSNTSIGKAVSVYYFKGSIATLSIYTGSKATESNILKAERIISKAYIGG